MDFLKWLWRKIKRVFRSNKSKTVKLKKDDKTIETEVFDYSYHFTHPDGFGGGGEGSPDEMFRYFKNKGYENE